MNHFISASVLAFLTSIKLLAIMFRNLSWTCMKNIRGFAIKLAKSLSKIYKWRRWKLWQGEGPFLKRLPKLFNLLTRPLSQIILSLDKCLSNIKEIIYKEFNNRTTRILALVKIPLTLLRDKDKVQGKVVRTINRIAVTAITRATNTIVAQEIKDK